MCYRKSLTNLLLIVKLTKNNNYIGHKGIRRTILCKVLKGGFAIKNWRRFVGISVLNISFRIIAMMTYSFSSKDHTAIQAIHSW